MHDSILIVLSESKDYSEQNWKQPNYRAAGYNRAATVVMYLKSPDWGGETNLPYAVPTMDHAMARASLRYSTCGQYPGATLHAHRGSAIFFHSMNIPHHYFERVSLCVKC